VLCAAGGLLSAARDQEAAAGERVRCGQPRSAHDCPATPLPAVCPGIVDVRCTCISVCVQPRMLHTQLQSTSRLPGVPPLAKAGWYPCLTQLCVSTTGRKVYGIAKLQTVTLSHVAHLQVRHARSSGALGWFPTVLVCLPAAAKRSGRCAGIVQTGRIPLSPLVHVGRDHDAGRSGELVELGRQGCRRAMRTQTRRCDRWRHS